MPSPEDIETYTVPATTPAEREAMEEARASADAFRKQIEANGASVDAQPAPAQAEAPITMFVSAEDEIPQLMDIIHTLIREKAQLRATCMKLLRERQGD